MRSHVRPLAALGLGVLLAHCADDDTPKPLKSPQCMTELPLQNPRAHVLGETFYLPAAAEGDGCPDKIEWDVVASPEGSRALVFNEGTPHARITPDVPGRYELRRRKGTETRSLEVVARSTAERFRNHYLTPLYGATRVGNEIWVANGAAYTVSRLVDNGGVLEKKAEIPVGPWPSAVAWAPGLTTLIVAHRGGDTIGFVDLARGVLEDALWVGDEPTGLALSPDARTLYVSLATEGAIVAVDLTTRTVRNRAVVGFDPRALAVSADGKRLFAASYRSGNRTNGPDSERPAEDDQDIFVVDTGTLTLERTINGVGADLRAIAVDGDELYVASTDGETLPSQADPAAKPFTHAVVVVDTNAAGEAFGQVRRSADLTRQSASTGPFVSPSGVLVVGDDVWVASESSNVVAILDRTTLAEKARIPVGQGPRQLVRMDDGVAVHCFRSFEVWLVGFDGIVRSKVAAAADPRPKDVALGEEVFSRPGGRFAENHACASCHVETQNDGMIWRFGPKEWANVRPLQLLRATTPLGWHAYTSNAGNFGFQGPGSIVARPVSTEEATGLSAFLGSLVGAPRATAKTRLDGSFSEEGLKGKAIFEGKAQCAGCHVPPLYTSRQIVEKGKSGIPADVPTLLGAYRHGVYFVKGQARSLPAAVDVATKFVGVPLNPAERTSLVRFLEELTPKGAAPMGLWPDLDAAEAVPTTVLPRVTFSEPVDDTQKDATADDLARRYVTLVSASGKAVDGTVRRDGTTLTFVPAAPLDAGGTYRFRVQAGLPFRDGGVLEGDLQTELRIAASPIPPMPERMTLTAYPAFPRGSEPPTPTPVALPVRVEDGPEGRTLVVTLGQGQEQRLWIHGDGATLIVQSFALPVGPTGALADANTVRGAVPNGGLVDGRIVRAEGTLRMTGPGFEVRDVRWELTATP